MTSAARKTQRVIKDVKESKGLNYDLIPVYGGNSSQKIKVKEISRYIILNGISTWITVVHHFRQYHPNQRQVSRMKVALRRYQWRNGKWTCRQSLNVNHADEASELVKHLLATFPEIER